MPRIEEFENAPTIERIHNNEVRKAQEEKA